MMLTPKKLDSITVYTPTTINQQHSSCLPSQFPQLTNQIQAPICCKYDASTKQGTHKSRDLLMHLEPKQLVPHDVTFNARWQHEGIGGGYPVPNPPRPVPSEETSAVAHSISLGSSPQTHPHTHNTWETRHIESIRAVKS